MNWPRVNNFARGFLERLEAEGYRTERHPYSVNAFPPRSEIRVQFTTDPRYQDFLARSLEAEVLGVGGSPAWRTSFEENYGLMAIRRGA